MSPFFWSISLLFLLTSCYDDVPFTPEKGELILRKESDALYIPPPPKPKALPLYPWEGSQSALAKITKEYFRCKGSSLNPPRQEIKGEEKRVYLDCSGASRHSLPLFNGKEGVYPILLDLLNYLQMRTNKKVVVTCGHRCPDHQTYADPSKLGQTSKKMIGAEVNFYVLGYENRSQEILRYLFEFYEKDPNLTPKQKKFERYAKDDVDVREKPWMNWEVFIKLYGKGEGRDIDNRHPYPYFSIQVRHDRVTGDRVAYDWNKAYHNFLRY